MINTKNLLTSLAVLFFIIFGLYLIKVFDISYPITLVSTTRSTELSVVGEGKVEAVPDTAYVDAGIIVNNLKTVEEVEKNINEINNKIIQAMTSIGIDKKDIKTSQYSINPNYNYESGQSKITGYNGSASINIKVKNMSNVSKVISAATNAGANQVRGARFTIDKPEVYREKARDAAIANAKAQAERLAKQTGIKLGKVVNIVESTPSNIYPLNTVATAAKGLGAAESAVIEPGSQTVTSTVTLYFEKK